MALESYIKNKFKQLKHTREDLVIIGH
jgi:hypothetical protein